MDVTSIDRTIVTRLKEDIAEAENYQESVIKPAVIDRYQAYYADKDYYRTKFPKLSQSSNLVSTDVSDTIEWALPSLLKIFTGSTEVVTVQGVTEEDDKNALVMQDLMTYQLQRKNHFFEVAYNWFKDSLITGLGIVKCYWEREEAMRPQEAVLGALAVQYLQQSNVQIVSIEPADMFGNQKVTYLLPYYAKNLPKLENILISEFLYSPDAKNLEEANFVAHKKRVNMSYLHKMEKQGIYANVDQVRATDPLGLQKDEVEQLMDDSYGPLSSSTDKARDKVVLYECFTKMDINDDGILEDLIITIVDDVILRIEENYMGRHPFFDLSPTKDPHRVWTKRSYAELIGELQDLKVALTRQIMQNIALTNDPKMVLSEDAINIDDYIKGRAVIRKKPGFQMNEVAMSMPPTPLHPWTFQFLEYIEGQKENRTGITRYNQGLDAKSLNKMLALDTPIPLADGSWKQNKDIVAGDKVIGSDGKETTVKVAHPIQMPKRAFEIEFKNGDVIKAGGEHRWSVKVSDKNYKHKSPEWEKLPTERIFDLMETGHHVFVPRVERIEFKEQQLPIDPYVFGLWLGDGNSHTNRFTTMDQEILEAFKNWAGQFYKGEVEPCKQQHSGKATTYSLVNTPFRKMLKDLGCLKDSRYEETAENVKHIPEIYLKGSYAQRLALLQGLMDTDGCIDKAGNAIFCNSEPALIETVTLLIESLGGKPNLNWTEIKGNKFENARPHCHITFSIRDCPVRLKRKADRWKTKASVWEQQSIVSIKEIPVEPMRCLTVEAEDELYCCGKRYTLTSNTATGISAIMSASNQRLELIARRFAETGISDLYRFLIGLNQKFVDQETVIRLTNNTLTVHPEDLQGEFDLIVNAGIGIATRESTMMNLQTIMTAIMQVQAQGTMIATPTNVYNLFKKWLEEAGFKNYSDYVTDPAAIQMEMMAQIQMKQQILASLPPEIQSYYMSTGTIPPQFLLTLPADLQVLLGGTTGGINGGQQYPNNPSAANGQGPTGQSNPGVSDGMAGSVPRGDNRQPQTVPRAGNGPTQEPSSGLGGF